MDRWIKKIRYTLTVDSSAANENGTRTLAAKWMEIIMLSEICPTRKDKCCMVSLM